MPWTWFVTTQNRGGPYKIELGNPWFLWELSVANVQGIGSIPAIRLQRKLGSLSTETLNRIKQALRSALDLERKEQQFTSAGVREMKSKLASRFSVTIRGSGGYQRQKPATSHQCR
jgi:hypothetical protein